MTVVAIAAFDGLAIVAALSGIGEDLGDIDLLPWVITAYLATSAIAVIAAGPVIDGVGVRRTFRVTGIWFVAWTAVAALAPSMPLLIAARAFQGLGGGLVIAVALAAIGLTFPHELRPRAFTANSLVWGGMGFAGPALAGLLLTVGDWRAIFLFQIPIALLALAMGWRSLPSTRDQPVPIRVDWTGLGLLALLTIASLVGVSEVGDRWWLAGAGAAVTALTGWAYWRHSARSTEPVLARSHLTRPPVSMVHVTSALILIAGLGADNYLPLYVRATRGRSEAVAAFSLLFLTVGWTLGSLIFSRVLDHWREADVIRLGASLVVPSSLASGLAIALDAPLWVVFAAFGLIGLSIGFVSTAGLTLLQASSAATEMGRANSAHQFIRTLAITYGVAAGGAILLFVVGRQLDDVEAVRELLAGEEVDVGDRTASAIGDGMVGITVFTTAVGVACLLAARRLARWTRRHESEPAPTG